MIAAGIKEFIEEQNRYKNLLVTLYQNRNLGGIAYPAAVEICNNSYRNDNGEILVERFVQGIQMGVDMDGSVVLDPSLRDVYERILENSRSFGTESVYRIRLEIERLCTEWKSAMDARDKRHLVSEIYKVLDRIPSSLEHGVGDLARLTDEEYKAAISFQLKKAKLKTILDNAAELHGLLEESHALLSDETHELRTLIMADTDVDTSMLEMVLRRARSQTAISSQSLVELTRRLHDYIAKIERSSRLLKRIRFVAGKLAQGTLETETNYQEVLMQYADIGIKGETYSKPSFYDIEHILENERNVGLVIGMRDEGTADGMQDIREPIDIAAETAAPAEATPPFNPNYRRLMRSFRSQGTDLFTFIFGYDFKRDVSHDRRLAFFLYLSTAKDFAGMLDYTDRSGTFRYVSDINGRKLIVKYTIIKPK